MTFSETAGRDSIWIRLANDIDGQFLHAASDYYTLGGIGSTVHLKVEQWSIGLEAYKQPSNEEGDSPPEIIRMRAPYNDKDSFRFDVSRQTLLSGLGKLFGMQDTEIGDPVFDKEFIIKCNDEAKARALFANAKIKQILQNQPYVLFQNGEGGSLPGSTLLNTANTEIRFLLSDDQADDRARLKSLFELFSETLRQLRTIGSA